ncbi:hypothetical protein ACFQVC_17110 [Streptomyces monticola]|uniref:Uncharacterized protein n=1 Tax=Streptomyces monticola TaxID=2666263 RepID=A0ABW2JKQ5_9ACTN
MREQAQGTTSGAADDALRESHAARTRSAAARTAATCHYLTSAGSSLVAGRQAGQAVEEPVLKAEHAVRTARSALEALTSSASDPAAHARCARNAAAAATLAAQTAQAHDGAGEAAVAASRAALEASKAAGDAAAKGSLGRDETLNAEAEAAERAAVAAAERAGWMQPGKEYLSQSSDEGEFTISLADVMHLEH